MAQLEKLCICGIRSFGHENEDTQVISFHRPLTLILGENGCGKSTIIECLRFITTQREPSGKASVFVHDPELEGLTVVKGFIKLRFRNAIGDRMYLSKILQATRTKKNITTKSLDSSITREDPVTKEKISTSNRCLDLMPEITAAFGVSRPILENVIFCTQEDALWPLDTDQKVKEKFDQIFDSDRYNKCINKIRDQRKKILVDVKTAETELKYLRENKKAATDKRNAVQKLETELRNFETQIKEFDERLIEISSQLKAAHQINLQIVELETLYTRYSTEFTEGEKRVKELKKQIQDGGYIYHGNDEELTKALESFKSQFNEGSDLKSELVLLDSTEKAISNNMMKEQSKLGQLEQLDQLNEEKKSNLAKMVNSLARILQAPNNDLQTIKNQICNKKNQFQDQLSECEVCEEVAQVEVNDSRMELLTHENLIKKKHGDLENTNEEIKQIKNDLDIVDASQSRLAKLTNQRQKYIQELEDLQSNVNSEDLKQELKQINDNIKTKEDELSSVESVIQVLQSHAQIYSELELLQDTELEKSSEFRRLKNKNEFVLKKVLNSVPDLNFKTTVDSFLSETRKKFDTLQDLENTKQREIAALEKEKNFITSIIKQKEISLKGLESKVKEIKKNEREDDINKSIDEVQKQLEELQVCSGTLTSSKFMYQQYINNLKKPKPCCPLCKRDFAQVQEAKKLSEDLLSRIQTLPAQEKENETAIKTTQTLLQKKQTLQPILEKIEECKTEISSSKDKLKNVEVSLLELKNECCQLQEKKITPKKDIAELMRIQGDMTLLDQLLLDQDKIKKQIIELQTKIPKQGPQGTLKESLEKQENIRRDIKKQKYNQDDIQSQINKFFEKQQMYQNMKDNLTGEIQRVSATGNRKELEEKLGKCLTVSDDLNRELIETKNVLLKFKKNLEDKLNNLKILKDENKKTTEKTREELDSLNREFENISKITKEVQDFENKNYVAQKEEIIKSISKLENEKESLKRSKDEINMKLSNLSKSDNRRRELEDNVAYRKKQESCQEIKQKIEEFEKKIKTLQQDSNIREKESLQKEANNLNDKKQGMGGRRGALKQQAEDLKRELEGKMYKNIDNMFKKVLVELEVNKSLGEDLFRYAAAIEWAIMKYHSQQMKRVNSFAREYWRNIYQGNDIDYIEILTEECEVTERRRNYNYKLVQVKGETRLDMRNRCSAGQKMLASLIIRMALAETFSNNCGILTLDEPTTNLDRKNISNLARTLNELLTEKQKLTNSNFQLIVITHDEAFLDELIQINAVEHFVSVSRDHRGRTRVTNKSVTA